MTDWQGDQMLSDCHLDEEPEGPRGLSLLFNLHLVAEQVWLETGLLPPG